MLWSAVAIAFGLIAFGWRRLVGATDPGRRRAPRVAVLVLSQYVEPSYAMRLLEEHPGWVGYLLEQRVLDVALLVDALRRIGGGETVVDRRSSPPPRRPAAQARSASPR